MDGRRTGASVGSGDGGAVGAGEGEATSGAGRRPARFPPDGGGRYTAPCRR
ncbi:MAG: hypothetical protein ACLVB5_12265 [Christensenellales bacterium]